ncbi:MAG: glucose-6-phosphate dehydrogenase, partial [Pseudomonadota bacterium]|nr:glucose-6-phosphate dehydrogenase [Pseudomonadota bacterium]
MALTDFDFVLFGGGGDLAMRKLIPALYALSRGKGFPQGGRIIAVGRHEWSREQYLEEINKQAKPNIEEARLDEAAWNAFCERVNYVSLNATDAGAYQPLKDALRDDDKLTRVYYLAMPPNLFAGICKNLAEAGLATSNARVVLEKPLGRDLEGARQINADVGQVFAESQIFRIDHYLGKEAVQNLLALRFGNILFEPLWRREWISDVQITIAEELG